MTVEPSLQDVRKYLIHKDPILQHVFTAVPTVDFNSLTKPSYVALIGAIIGQKISFLAARKFRSALYSKFGTNFSPIDIVNGDLSFLPQDKVRIIKNITLYIINNQISLNTEKEIVSLLDQPGIGPWTVNTTLLTCMKNWDIYPEGDVFLKKRLQMLYGENCDIKSITQQWSPYRSLVTWHLWRMF